MRVRHAGQLKAGVKDKKSALPAATGKGAEEKVYRIILSQKRREGLTWDSP